MKRSLSLPVVTLLVLLVSDSAKAGDLEVTINSIPPGARVESGGSDLGITPLKLTYPTAYFRAPQTVFARYLTAPLKFVLTKDGYEPKEVEIGDPHRWVSLNGLNRFNYYLLKRSYVFKLDRPRNDSAADMLVAATALQKLAELRDAGILTEQEFQAKKALLVTKGSPTSVSALLLDESTHPAEFCTSLYPPPSAYHKIESGAASIVAGSSGPVAKCLWVQPEEGVASIKFYVQCGIADAPSSCETVAQRDSSDQGGSLRCLGKASDGDFLAIYDNGCAVRTAASGEASIAESLVTKLLHSFPPSTDQ